MKYTLNKQQYSELEGLAYHIADLNYMQECGENNAELELKRKTISLAFNQLDNPAFPFGYKTLLFAGLRSGETT